MSERNREAIRASQERPTAEIGVIRILAYQPGELGLVEALDAPSQ